MDLKKIFNSADFKEFKLDHINLTLITQTDTDFINQLFTFPDVKKYFILSEEHQNNINLFVTFLIARFKKYQGLDFIIHNTENNPVGLITCDIIKLNENLIGKISYAIHKDYRNKGYAKEALQFMCQITDQSQLSSLQLDINVENIASERIAERLGFKSNKKLGLFDPNIPEIDIRHLWHRDCYKEFPKRVELSLNGMNSFRNNDYYKAIDFFKASLKYENPDGSPHNDAQIYSNLGMALTTTKQYKEAYHYLMKAYNAGLRNEAILKEIKWLKTNAKHHL